MSQESIDSQICGYGMDTYGFPFDYPYGDPYAGSPSPNGWTVCGIVDSAYCPYGLGYYKENGSYYCCCHTDSNGQLPRCDSRKHDRIRRRIPAHHKTGAN